MLEYTENQDEKECKNCGHRRPGTCWYMTCCRGYTNGTSDDWIPQSKSDIFKKIEESSWGDYEYSEEKSSIGDLIC